MTHHYRAFGLTIVSDHPLPELPDTQALLPPDIRIEMVSDLGMEIPPEAEQDFVPGAESGFVFRVADTADFHVASGRSIRFSPHACADWGLLRLYLLGSAMGMALHQRGLLVLHASAVLRDGGVSLFIGESGAGKSTLAARLARAGLDVLADDVMAIHQGAEGQLSAWPGARSFKLWADALDSLGLDRTGLTEIASRTEKYFVLNARTVPDAAYPVREVVVLDYASEGQAASMEDVPALEAVREISSNTYRSEYSSLLGREAEHFRQCAVLAAAVPVRRFRRRWDSDLIDADVGLLLMSAERVSTGAGAMD